jgi:hypothetical protein
MDDVVRDARAVWSLFRHADWSCVDWWLWLQSEKLNFIGCQFRSEAASFFFFSPSSEMRF